MTSIVLHIPGVPQQQGSKTKWGTEENTHVIGWRESIARQGQAQMHGESPLHGPVDVHATFVFPRPKAHYRNGKNSGVLRDDAPIFHTSFPDLDKLQRAVGDALSGVIILDDRQIASWHGTKRYGDETGARIIIQPLLPA